jgi:hypothetical protein
LTAIVPVSAQRQSPQLLHARQTQGETLTVKELRKLERWKWSTQGIISSARDHLGKFLDAENLVNVKALEDMIIDVALAIQSYNVFNGQRNGPTTALIGPIALKLATAPGGLGIPVVQGAGLAMLAAMGIVSVPGVGSALASLQSAITTGVQPLLQPLIPPGMITSAISGQSGPGGLSGPFANLPWPPTAGSKDLLNIFNADIQRLNDFLKSLAVAVPPVKVFGK